jgi:GABA permease
MRRYLVVAHRTLGGAHLMEHLHRLREEDPYCRFHLVVPRHHASTGPTFETDQVAAARAVLEEVLDQMAAMGMGATGAVGDANPVLAVDDAIRREGESNITGIIVSTLPQSTSAWLRGAVPDRIAKSFPLLPVTHVVAEEAVV